VVTLCGACIVTNNKNNNNRDLFRGINEFKKGYRPRNNIIEDENGNLLSDPHSVLNRWKGKVPVLN
jgi:hypothetical protein